MTKKSEKNEKNFAGSKKDFDHVADRLRKATNGLLYVSEIDAPFTVVESTGDDKMLSRFAEEGEVEEVDFPAFFERLTRERDWFGDRERKRAKKFLDLQKLIEESLTDLKVYRFGRVKIRILVVGKTSDGRYIGLETNAVET